MSRATPLTTWESIDNPRAQKNGHADHIGQTHLPFSFGLAHAAQHVSDCNSSLEAPNPATDVVLTLASKMLQAPLFIAMEWSSLDIQPAKVCHLAGRILKGKTSSLSYMNVAQATMNFPTAEDFEEAARRRASLLTYMLRMAKS